MRAIGYRQNLPVSDARSLEDVELPVPSPRPRDLLVRVSAISVNPVDTKIRQSRKPAAGQVEVLGWDAVGVVEGVGTEVSLFKAGDRVYYAG
ncbi:MAG TPA: alcohol dehydrogenase catalytic domain-containing protein, partial [Gemmatimonadales bacterium]|nr:alcohol dehydrogenase catalytic domain-containing protein [Gemmatimonadales bacterium]